MRTVIIAVAVLLADAGGAAAAARPGVQTISYETGPCFGTCPVYKVTVSSDGRGVFEGKRFTAVTGRRDFRISRAQWQAFRSSLQALHGHGTVDLTGPPLCHLTVSDMLSVEVRWSGAWRPHLLKANYGCRSDTTEWQFAHLRRVPDTLPIARFMKADVPFPPRR